MPGIALGEAALRTVMNNMTLSLECEQAGLATKLDTYVEANRREMAGAEKWSDPASDPSGDIDAAKDAVHAAHAARQREIAKRNAAVSGVEIFKAGRHKPMSGEMINFLDSGLEKIARNYDAGAHPAPIVIGHPQTDAQGASSGLCERR